MGPEPSKSSLPSSVTIIGAGLAGLALALTLSKESIPVSVYELRQPKEGHIVGGAIMLSPNGLRIMDKLGIYERIQDQGYKFTDVDFRNDRYERQAQWHMGSEKLFGYDGLRIYRQILINVMKEMLTERRVPIHYGKGFARIVEDSDSGVVFETSDGEQHETGMLIGADGIHSTVRRHVTSTVPKYTGTIAVTSAVASDALRVPTGIKDFKLPLTVMGKRGAFVMAPQTPDGSEQLVGTQYKHPELDAAGWRALTSDTAKVKEMICAGREIWPELVQSAMDAVKGEKMNVWPFYVLPKLERWASTTGKVVLIGDAAHAIPPSSGQGINQAFEDAYALGVLLPKLDAPGVTTASALEFWQGWRQARVDRVLELGTAMDNLRAPEAERKEVRIASGDRFTGKPEQFDWLYAPQLERDMEAWIDSQQSSEL